jgi:hypothetical protein
VSSNRASRPPSTAVTSCGQEKSKGKKNPLRFLHDKHRNDKAGRRKMSRRKWSPAPSGAPATRRFRKIGDRDDCQATQNRRHGNDSLKTLQKSKQRRQQ